MPKPTGKQIKATAKWIDRLVAAYISYNPGTLQFFGKEAIRDTVLTEELRKAIKRAEATV